MTADQHPEPRPGAPKADPILVCAGIRRHYGGIVANDIERLEIQAGWVTSIIGPNGAGKTTLFNIVSGFERADRGTWSSRGRPLAGRPSSALAHHGLVRTFQHTRTFARMTVLENMMLAAPAQRGERLATALLPRCWRKEEGQVAARARELVARFGLEAVRHMAAAQLSGGQRKLLELARAVMAKPSLLLLDEPLAGVNPVLREAILDHISALRAEGVTVVLIEHDLDAVSRISDWLVCLAEGRVIAEGPVDAVRRNPEVIDAYLGRRHAVPAGRAEMPSTTLPPQDDTGRSVAFEVRNLVAGYLPGVDVLNGCTLVAYKNEAVGIFGPNGAGKSTLLKAVVGQARVRGGDILLEERSIVGVAPHLLPQQGLGYVPQLDNVFATLTVEENLRLGLYTAPKAWQERYEDLLQQFPVLRQLWRKRADDLSGGERKLVAVARALILQPRVLLFDEPSAGLSPARQVELFELITRINITGVTVIIVEQNARQCLEICDRGYVLDRGANAFTGRAPELLSNDKVVSLYLGTLHRERKGEDSQP